MNFSGLFYVFGVIFLVMWLASSIFGPSTVSNEASNASAQEEIVAIYNEQAADGLDLQALIAVVKDSANAENLEENLNKEGGVNNLDLNADGVIDYIKVEEFPTEAEGSYGFSLTTEPAQGEVQELAVIEIKQQGDQAEVTVEGNQQIYGASAYYGGFSPITSILLMSYLLRPHPFYFSPYGYGNYPGSYNSPRTSSSTDYKNRAGSYNSGAAGKKSTGTSLKSPNAGKTASTGIKRSLKNPSAAQRSFRQRSSTQALRSGGFGQGVQRSTASRGSAFGSGQRSVRSFSGSRRSFGGGFGK